MTNAQLYPIHNQVCWLSAERCLFWEDERILIVSDLHIGKTGHFRKSGIPVPQKIYKDDLHRLLAQIMYFKADRLLIVGDLSHSRSNKELDLFARWRKDFPLLKIDLVKGNHDILDSNWYTANNITVHDEELRVKNFCFRHSPETIDTKEIRNNCYYFSGHLHPGVHLRGVGKQSLYFPCFYFAKNHCVLPAFSYFTGSYRVRPAEGEKVFVIVEGSVVEVS
jgi:DNA ligase-associated metallophosphoesterase